jgi:hypothetical protein
MNESCFLNCSVQGFSLHDSARSPKFELFTHFRDLRPEIDQTKYRTAMEDKEAAQ